MEEALGIPFGFNKMEPLTHFYVERQKQAEIAEMPERPCHLLAMIAVVYAMPRDSLALARQLENHSLRLSPAPLFYGRSVLIHVHSKVHMVKISRSKQAMQCPHILVSRHFLLHCHRPTARLSTEHTDDLHLSPLRFLKLSVSLKCLFSIYSCVVLLLICVFVLF